MNYKNYKIAQVSINNFNKSEHYFIYVKYDEEIENVEEAISRTEDLSNIQWMVTDLRDASLTETKENFIWNGDYKMKYIKALSNSIK